MKQPLFAIVAGIVLVTRFASAQSKACNWPPMNPSPQNLSFSEGEVGAAPVGWLLGQSFLQPHRPAYEALIVEGNPCHAGGRCATIHSLPSDSSGSLAFLYQDLQAAPYRGQILVLRAYVRIDPTSKGVGRLLVRVHGKDCSTTFFDNMGDHPVVSGEWAAYEIKAPIATAAEHIEFGVQMLGVGAVWIDNISVDAKPLWN